MTVEIAQQVSKLLDEKIKFETDLSRLLSQDYNFSLSLDSTDVYARICGGGIALSINNNLDFNVIMKELVITKLKQEIKRVEEEINKLDCK